ncbi:Nicotinamide N-methyltransferase [Geodia barretti]|uniref:Nicotinamide N-methyltransferase n=1 Tax=Geodia barretti TaxID=519541 RepID=A0AA35X6B7_GEOBA|nr:Nicotinamide N-methyltransferase [Geodia barretti]
MSLLHQSQYLTHFSTKLYLEAYYSNVESDYFRMRLLHEFFRKYSSKWNRGSARLLDFGGGPVILNYISAAPHVAEIVHAAYKDDERKEIELWKNDAEGAYGWNPHIMHVVSELEGLKGNDAWQERAALMRSKIKVVSCNIFDKHPIDPSENPNSFSIVCTSLCLEGACETVDGFKAGIKKLVRLLRLGGYITILFVEDQTYYYIGEEKWASLPISLAQVKEAVEEAGCVVLISERDPMPLKHFENPTYDDAKACVFLAAYKVKE